MNATIFGVINYVLCKKLNIPNAETYGFIAGLAQFFYTQYTKLTSLNREKWEGSV
jgi:hypothetical protein